MGQRRWRRWRWCSQSVGVGRYSRPPCKPSFLRVPPLSLFLPSFSTNLLLFPSLPPPPPPSLFPPHGRIAVVPSFFLRASPSTFLPYSLERSVFYRVQPKTRLLHYSSRCLHTVSPYILYAVTWGTAEKTYRSVWLVLQLGD